MSDVDSPEPRVSECTICPPQVMRCVHFGDVSIVMASYQQMGACARHVGFDVGRLDGPMTFGTWDCCGAPCIRGNNATMLAWTPKIDDAVAAFNEAEEALLRGDD